MNCPNCNSLIEDNSTVCPVCGYNFYPQQNTDFQQPQNMQYPPDYNMPYYDNNQFQQIPVQTAEKKKNVGLIAVIIGILVIALCGGGYWYYNSYVKKDDNENQVVFNSQPDSSMSLIEEIPEITTSTAQTTLVTTTTVKTTTTVATTKKPKKTTAATTTEKKEEVTAGVLDGMSGCYNGGIEHPRIQVYVLSSGNYFDMRVVESAGAFDQNILLYSGDVENNKWLGSTYFRCNRTVNGDIVHYEQYDFEVADIIFQPDTNTILYTPNPGMDYNTITLEKSNETSSRNFVSGYVSTDGYLNVRQSNNANSNIIGKLDNNDKVNIIDELNGWYLIVYNGGFGYVSGEFIKLN